MLQEESSPENSSTEAYGGDKAVSDTKNSTFVHIIVELSKHFLKIVCIVMYVCIYVSTYVKNTMFCLL